MSENFDEPPTPQKPYTASKTYRQACVDGIQIFFRVQTSNGIALGLAEEIPKNIERAPLGEERDIPLQAPLEHPGPDPL